MALRKGSDSGTGLLTPRLPIEAHEIVRSVISGLRLLRPIKHRTPPYALPDGRHHLKVTIALGDG